jgi:hypothetical protein
VKSGSRALDRSLRAVLVRLLAEVEDPVVLSLAVARVVNTQARSLSVQRA